jgi:hypothetical protein
MLNKLMKFAAAKASTGAIGWGQRPSAPHATSSLEAVARPRSHRTWLRISDHYDREGAKNGAIRRPLCAKTPSDRNSLSKSSQARLLWQPTLGRGRLLRHSSHCS